MNDRNGNTESQPQSRFSQVVLDAYDRAYVLAHGFPATRESTVTVPTVAEGVRQYTIQTFRAPESQPGIGGVHGDTVFITIVGPDGLQRVFLPPKVTQAIASQRDALTAKSRSRAAKARAQADKAKGIVPGFMRGKKKARA